MHAFNTWRNTRDYIRLTNSIKSSFFAHRITSQPMYWAQNIAKNRSFKISSYKFNSSYSLEVLALLKRHLRRQSANDTDLQIGRLLVGTSSIEEQLALSLRLVSIIVFSKCSQTNHTLYPQPHGERLPLSKLVPSYQSQSKEQLGLMRHLRMSTWHNDVTWC